MADKELKVKVVFDADGAVKGVEKLTNETKELDQATERVGKTSTDLTDKLAKGAIVIGSVTVAAHAAREALDKFEATSGIINRFSGNIEEAKRRTNGLASEIELMTAANRAAAAGLQLSQKQFADVAVAAQEYAAATGRDATQAIDELVIALASGEREGLKRFGLAVTGVTGNVETQRAALQKLSEKYGDMESSADTLAGQITVLDNAFSDLYTTFVESVNTVEEYRQKVDGLNASSTGMKDLFFAVNEVVADFGVTVATVADNVGQLGTIFFKMATGQFSEIPKIIDQIDGFTERLLRNLEVQRAARNAARLDGGGGSTPAAVTGATTATRRRTGGRSRAEQSTPTNPLLRMRGGVTENSEFSRLAAGGAGGSGVEGAFGINIEATQGAADSIRTLRHEFEDLFGTSSQAAEFASSMGGALGIVQASMADTINAVAQGEQSMSEAMENLAANLLKSIGEHLVGEGVKNMFVGLGRVLTSYGADATGPGLIALGAAEIAGGVALGAAGAAIAPQGAGAGSQPAEPTAPAGNNASTPEPSTIVVNYNAPMPLEQVGRSTDLSLRAARRRGAVRS